MRRHCLNLSIDGWLTNSCGLLFHSLMALGKNENFVGVDAGESLVEAISAASGAC